MKTTLKDIRRYPATDISEMKYNAVRSLADKIGWRKTTIAYSVGVYGVNGLVFMDRETGELYKVIGRTTALFMFL